MSVSSTSTRIFSLPPEASGDGERLSGTRSRSITGSEAKFTIMMVRENMPASLEALPEEPVIVEDEAEPAEDDDVGIGLDADPGEKALNGSPATEQNRDLLLSTRQLKTSSHRHVRCGSSWNASTRRAGLGGRPPILIFGSWSRSGPPSMGDPVPPKDPPRKIGVSRSPRADGRESSPGLGREPSSHEKTWSEATCPSIRITWASLGSSLPAWPAPDRSAAALSVASPSRSESATCRISPTIARTLV